MSENNELDCKIYVDTKRIPDEIVALVTSIALVSKVEKLSGARIIHTPCCELEIRMNEDADDRRVRNFPDGFLYFPYALELYPCPTAPHESRVNLVTSLLSQFWSQGIPAIAACDYELELPCRGGYDNPSVPWPGKLIDTTPAVRHPADLSGPLSQAGI